MAIKRKEMLFSFTVASSKGLVTGTRYRDRSCEVGFGGVVVSADSYKELIERVRQGSELGDWPRDALRSVLIKLGREMIGQGADSDVDEESICWHPIGEVVDGEGNSIGILEGGHDLPKPTYH